MKKIIIVLLIVIPLPVFAGRGCCSWHGGQYGCSKDGRVVCMDGSYSPTCTCRAAVKKKKTVKRKTASFDSLNKTTSKSYSSTFSSSNKKSSTKTTKKKTTTKSTKKKKTNKIKSTTINTTKKGNNNIKTSVKDSADSDDSPVAFMAIGFIIGGLAYLGIKSERH